MPSDNRPILLCFSRSYLSRLFPAMAARHPQYRYLHIVQTDREKRSIESTGGEVAISLQTCVREALSSGGSHWDEPADFRDITEFHWCPIEADRYLPEFPPKQRNRIAGAVFAAVREIFEQHRIVGLLSEPVALFTTHCLFYLARKHNSRSLMWANAWFPGWFYFIDGIDASTAVRAAPIGEIDLAAMKEDVRLYTDGVANDRRGPAYHPAFIERQLSLLSFFKQRRGEEPLVTQTGPLAQGIQVGRLARATFARATFPRSSDFMTAGSVSEHRSYLRAMLTSRRVYDAVPLEHCQKNVVFPLQYEPEASLLYFAPAFRDQFAVVENIMRALPQGHILWVKEHPNQFGALGVQRWQELRRRFDNLRFVHGRESGRALMRCAGLTVTISSSAGMDALVLGRQVLVLGSVFFRYFPGAVPLNSYEELAAALNDPARYMPTDNRSALVESLIDFGTRCYPGDPQPRHDLFKDDNLDQLTAAIDQRMALEQSQ